MAAVNQKENQKDKRRCLKKREICPGCRRRNFTVEQTDGAKQEHESAEQSDVQQLVDILARALKRGDQGNEIKRNVRPPRVYSFGQNFKTWHSQFLQYANFKSKMAIGEHTCLHS